MIYLRKNSWFEGDLHQPGYLSFRVSLCFSCSSVKCSHFSLCHFWGHFTHLLSITFQTHRKPSLSTSVSVSVHQWINFINPYSCWTYVLEVTYTNQGSFLSYQLHTPEKFLWYHKSVPTCSCSASVTVDQLWEPYLYFTLLCLIVPSEF